MGNEMIQNSLGHLKPLMPNSILNPKNLEGIQKKDDDSFSKILKDSIQSINSLQKNANAQVEKLAKGEVQDVHQVMTAVQEANLTFKLMMKVRNQIVSAYKEISKG